MQSGDVAELLRTLTEHGPALRNAGFETVTLPSGLSFTLRAAAPSLPSGAAAQAPIVDEDDEVPEDEAGAETRETREAEKSWSAYWERMTRSSGAPIPPFPGLETFRKVGRGLGVGKH